jgi:hypothetical protein
VDVYIVSTGSSGEGLVIREVFGSLRLAKSYCLGLGRATPILVAHGVWAGEAVEKLFDEVWIHRMRVQDE